RASEQRFRVLAEHSPAGIWQITPDGLTTYVNEAMCQLLEVADRGTLTGRNIRDFFTPESVEVIQREHRKRVLGISSTYAAELVSAKGCRRNVLISGAPMMNPDGTLACMIATILDITQRQRAEEKLRESEERWRLALSAGDMGVWEWDLPSGKITWSEEHA